MGCRLRSKAFDTEHTTWSASGGRLTAQSDDRWCWCRWPDPRKFEMMDDLYGRVVIAETSDRVEYLGTKSFA